MAATFGLAEGRFRQLYGSLRHAYDRGDVTAHQYWTEMARAAGAELSAGQVEHLREIDLAMWSRLNQSVLHWAGQLRATGMKTAVLSNMHDDMVQKIRKDPTWAELFDCLTLSSAIHIAKPDPGIFHRALETLGVVPGRALHVGDTEEADGRGARAAGVDVRILDRGRGVAAAGTISALTDVLNLL